jgi:hypothetical protein
VIHDRRIPGSFANIDHIVAAPSGVYVIDAKDWKGQVEIRSKGTWPFRKKLLYVNKRNRTPHLARFGAQVRAVTDAISDVRLELAPRPVMCFVGVAPRRKITLNDVEIVGPSALREMLLSDGPLTSEQIKAVGRALVYNLRERAERSELSAAPSTLRT